MKFATFVLFVYVFVTVSMVNGASVALPRIIGGVEAADGIAPHQCSIQYQFEHFCGGAILSDKYILTAAHCRPNNIPLDTLSILVGTNDVKKGGERYLIEKFIMHKNYKGDRYGFDIALIRVKKSIQFSSKVKSIPYSKVPVQPNSAVQLYGWGRLQFDPPIRPSKLQSINLTSISNKQCDDMFGIKLPVGIMCTLNKRGEGACHGDSGGGLVFQGKIVGIVSFGSKPCAGGLPDAFTEVAFYHDWIQENMRN